MTVYWIYNGEIINKFTQSSYQIGSIGETRKYNNKLLTITDIQKIYFTNRAYIYLED